MPRFSGMRLALKFAPPLDKTPPRVLSSASGSVYENSALAFTITTDEKTTKAVTGGADAAQFEIVTGATSAFSHTLRWVGNKTQDYENPADADLNNVYVVQITATDESGRNSTNQTVSITVLDVVIEDAGKPIGLLLSLTKAS